jgi:hypothetical protein
MSAIDTNNAYGYSENKNKLLKRLARAEGQVRGIARMVEGRPVLHRHPHPACGRRHGA